MLILRAFCKEKEQSLNFGVERDGRKFLEKA